jgi:hypothetical protein
MIAGQPEAPESSVHSLANFGMVQKGRIFG